MLGRLLITILVILSAFFAVILPIGLGELYNTHIFHLTLTNEVFTNLTGLWFLGFFTTCIAYLTFYGIAKWAIWVIKG